MNVDVRLMKTAAELALADAFGNCLPMSARVLQASAGFFSRRRERASFTRALGPFGEFGYALSSLP